MIPPSLNSVSSLMMTVRPLKTDCSNCFYIKLMCFVDEAVLVYEKKQDVIDLYHTEVPMGYTGRGIAGILAKVPVNYFNPH